MSTAPALRPAGIGLAIVLALGALAASSRWGNPFDRWLSSGRQVETDWQGGFVQSVQRISRLQVLRVATVAIINAKTPGVVRLLDVNTVAVVPGLVTYHVDLSGLRAADVQWDAAANRMRLLVPRPQPSEVNIPGERVRILVDGVDLSTGDQREAAFKASTGRARSELTRQARGGFYRGEAEAAARAALAGALTPLLQASRPGATLAIEFVSRPALPAAVPGK